VSEADMTDFLSRALSLLVRNAFRLLLLPSQVVIAATHLLLRSICWTVHNSLVRRSTCHLIRLPFRITAIVTYLLYRLVLRLAKSSIAALIYLLDALLIALICSLKAIFFARTTRYTACLAILIIVYFAISNHLKEREHERQRRLAEDQHRNIPSQDFYIWRNNCIALSKDKASITTLPQPPKDLATLYKNANLSTAELKRERQIWHPDAWSKVPEPHKVKVVRVVTEVFQIVNSIHVESREKDLQR
jgi:hypothetical protein